MSEPNLESPEMIRAIVKKLNGEINPVGGSNVDDDRFENLENLCKVIDLLIGEVRDVCVQNKISYEYSRKKAGEYAKNFLLEIKESIGEI